MGIVTRFVLFLPGVKGQLPRTAPGLLRRRCGGVWGAAPPREKRLVAVIGSKSHKRMCFAVTKYTAASLSREMSLCGTIYVRVMLYKLVSVLWE